MKTYRWNRKKCAENLLALATGAASVALTVWLLCTWILSC